MKLRNLDVVDRSDGMDILVGRPVGCLVRLGIGLSWRGGDGWHWSVKMVKGPDDRIGAEGPGEMERRGLGASTFGELGSMSREERAAKYQRDMKPFADADLQAARGDLVQKYRARPQAFPDGIDSKWDRWYVAEDWTDAGVYMGEGPCIKAVRPDPGALGKEDADRKARLAKARGVLAGVEGRLGVKPVVVPPAADVTEIVPVSRSSGADVTEIAKPGPKPSGRALSPAERKRLERAKKKDRGE